MRNLELIFAEKCAWSSFIDFTRKELGIKLITEQISMFLHKTCFQKSDLSPASDDHGYPYISLSIEYILKNCFRSMFEKDTKVLSWPNHGICNPQEHNRPYNSCELCPIFPKLGTGFYQNQNYIFDILAQDPVRGISRIHLISCPVLRETLQFIWELYLESNQRLIYKFCSEMLWKCYLGLDKNHADDSVWHSPRIMWKLFICRNCVVDSCKSSLKILLTEMWDW